VIPSEDKKFARVEALSVITKALAKGVDLGPPPLDERVKQEAATHFESYRTLIDSTAGRSE
jgi:hypothetical protein